MSDDEKLLSEVVRQRDQLQRDNALLEKAARDAIDVAVHRMAPETYWALVAERDALVVEVERLRAVYEAACRYTDTARELQVFSLRGGWSLAAMIEHDDAHRDVMAAIDRARNVGKEGV